MTEEAIETVTTEEEENEPIYYKPKALSMISTIAAWLSWVVLVIFVLVCVSQFKYIVDAIQPSGKSLMDMLGDPEQGGQIRNFLYTNIVLPLFSGLSFFVLLQAANIGLNSLLEIDFNLREMSSK